jgi:hypothetical protein
MIQLYLTQTTSNLFLNSGSTSTVDCGLSIVTGKWYNVVLIVNLFDLQRVELIVNYDSVFIEKSSNIISTDSSALEFQFGTPTNDQIFIVK